MILNNLKPFYLTNVIATEMESKDPVVGEMCILGQLPYKEFSKRVTASKAFNIQYHF